MVFDLAKNNVAKEIKNGGEVILENNWRAGERKIWFGIGNGKIWKWEKHIKWKIENKLQGASSSALCLRFSKWNACIRLNRNVKCERHENEKLIPGKSNVVDVFVFY